MIVCVSLLRGSVLAMLIYVRQGRATRLRGVQPYFESGLLRSCVASAGCPMFMQPPSLSLHPRLGRAALEQRSSGRVAALPMADPERAHPHLGFEGWTEVGD
jgi:hypothetical protein